MSTTLAGASPEAIQFHYDVSNEFYERWLGKSMVYSCARFANDEDEHALDVAQRRKLDLLIEWAGVKCGHRVLEIGCGWGALLERLVSTHGAAHATGLSLSLAQTEWFGRRAEQRIDVRVQSWVEHLPPHPYDAIISIEALEAFVKPGMSRAARVAIYRHLFERCHAWLVPGGNFVLQTIAYGSTSPGDLDPFISREIFPESDLPTLEEISAACHSLFEVRTLVNDREQYVRTLRAWLARFMAQRDALVGLVGAATVDRYERYLKLCTYMFASGQCALYRIALRRTNPIAAQSRQSPHLS